MTAETVYSVYNALSEDEKQRFFKFINTEKKPKRKKAKSIFEKLGWSEELLYNQVKAKMIQNALRRQQKEQRA